VLQREGLIEKTGKKVLGEEIGPGLELPKGLRKRRTRGKKKYRLPRPGRRGPTNEEKTGGEKKKKR